jgi:glycosyltransferase involved in cell wall biosynthesis
MAREDQIRIFHATEITAFPGPFAGGQVWATVYDLIPLVFWEKTQALYPIDYRVALRRAWKRLKSVDRIITISAHSKTDICERLDIAASRVDVVYPGCNAEWQRVNPEIARDRLQRSYGIQGNFLFYVGGSGFRKNLGVLVEAYARLRKRGYTGLLVLAGETFLWDVQEVRVIREQIDRLSVQEWVILPGFVPEEDLPLFYSGCEAFVFPSLYEGFGLPILEAMQCGAPVICCEVSAVPEVAGDCATYFDPRSPDDLANKLEALCADPDQLGRRQQAGMKRARNFDWSKAAGEVLALYEKHG